MHPVASSSRIQGPKTQRHCRGYRYRECKCPAQVIIPPLTDSKDDGTPPKYDLPPPSTGAQLAVTPTTPANGEANGAPAEMTDDLRYHRDRTGWAPRFEIQKPDDEEEGTLLDHQDFLESKLDDKFFGGRSAGYHWSGSSMLTLDSHRLVPQCRYNRLCLSDVLDCRCPRRRTGMGLYCDGRMWYLLSHVHPPCPPEFP